MARGTAAVRKRDEVVISTHRQTEFEWIRTHRDELRRCAGQWVVVEGAALVAHGKDAVRVVARARRRGITVPLVFYVEPPDIESTARLGL
jgi:hypothetical protein